MSKAEERYRDELFKLLDRAWVKIAGVEGLSIFEFNLWTDFGAGVSAVSIETKKHSNEFVKRTNAWHTEQADRMRRAGDNKMADLIGVTIDRNDNPADFQFRELVSFEHAKWTPLDDTQSKIVTLYDILIRLRPFIRDQIRQRFSFEPDALITVNSPRDWRDHPMKIGDDISAQI